MVISSGRSPLRFTATVLLFATSLFLSCAPARAQATDEAEFLTQIEKDTFAYFVKYTDKKTGLTADSSMSHSPSSIAATGFKLLAYAVAAEHQWINRMQAYNEVKKTLNTLLNKVQHEHGFFYHFISTTSGKRVWASEASSIDTALVIACALFAGDYFKGTPVERMANELYRRVDWQWMLNNTTLFSHGYKPESGFLPYYWDMYSEHLILQALAIGAPAHAVSPAIWKEWQRLEDSYNDTSIVYAHSGALFTYQFSHLFIDFRNLNDNGINYFTNSTNATMANRAFCINNSTEYHTYGETMWGLSASLGPRGYKAYGAKPGRAFHDGTIAPYAVLCSLPFAPDDCLRTIKNIHDVVGANIYGACGFRDSFNLDQNWYADQYIGIDQGASLAMIENYRSELIWKRMMQLPAIKTWISRCGLDTPPPAAPEPARKEPASKLYPTINQ